MGIRQSQLALDCKKPEFVSNLKLLADAGLCLDAIPRRKDEAATVLLRVTDMVPSLRLIIEHYPNTRLPADRAALDTYMVSLRELGKRREVYIKLSEVVKKINGKVSTDLSIYRDWLDQLWDIFGENRVIFGSDWPQSENLELNSYPNVISPLARACCSGKGPQQWRKSSGKFRTGIPMDPAEFDPSPWG